MSKDNGKYINRVFDDLVKHTKVIRLPREAGGSKVVVISPIYEDFWLFFTDFNRDNLQTGESMVIYEHWNSIYSITIDEFYNMWEEYAKFVRDEVIFYG